MSRNKSDARSHDFDRARNDLFSYIHRCAVMQATEQHQLEWMTETIDYLAECYPGLTDGQKTELRAIGTRFCRPVIDNVQPDADRIEASDEEGSTEASVAAA